MSSKLCSPHFCTGSSELFLSTQRMQNSSPVTPLGEKKKKIIQIPISSSASVVFKSANSRSLLQQHKQPGGDEIVQAEGSLNAVYPEFYSQSSRVSPSSQDCCISNSLGRALSLKRDDDLASGIFPLPLFATKPFIPGLHSHLRSASFISGNISFPHYLTIFFRIFPLMSP